MEVAQNYFTDKPEGPFVHINKLYSQRVMIYKDMNQGCVPEREQKKEEEQRRGGEFTRGEGPGLTEGRHSRQRDHLPGRV